MKERIAFGIFALFLVWQLCASFSQGFGFGVVHGFRMYERTGRYICRAQYYKLSDRGSWESLLLKNELKTGSPDFDFEHLKIYAWDWAEKLGNQLCEKQNNIEKFAVELQCRTDFGFGDPVRKEFSCP